MKTITQRYEELSNMNQINEKNDKLILECFHYKIFKEAPSATFKKNFKSDYGFDYPEHISDITDKLAKELQKRIKHLKEDEAFEEKCRVQRARKGYADADTWAIDSWFIRTMTPMLKRLRKYHCGYPSCFITDITDSVKTEEEDNEKWNQVLDRMIFLLNEMDEDKCTMKNPYAKEYHRINSGFRRKYGLLGEKAKTPEMLAEEENAPGVCMCSAADFPNLYPTAQKVREDYIEFGKKIDEYRDKCKDEFFELFSKYFWCLWD